MAMGRRRKLPDLKRKTAHRQPKRRFILYCEGKNTEPAYFAAISRRCDSLLVRIERIAGAGVPLVLAEKAALRAQELGLTGETQGKIDSFEENDEVWAVFDRDNHPNFEEAVKLCSKSKVGVARSNPCFEVWLILHLSDYDRPGNSKDAQKALKEFMPNYDPDRRKLPDCDMLMDLIEAAETRAKRQLKSREEEGKPFGSPSTTVFLLTSAIRQASRAGNHSAPRNR